MAEHFKRHFMLVAHGSDLPEWDCQWRDMLLGRLDALCPGVPVDMAFIKHKGMLSPFTGGAGQYDVLPLCLRDGIVCRQLIPEFVENNLLCQGVDVTMMHPLSQRLSGLTKLVGQIACESVAADRRPETELVLVAHGRRKLRSSDMDLLDHDIPGQGEFYRCHKLLLEQGPSFDGRLDCEPGRDILVISCFLSSGRHVMRDIPRLMGFDGDGEPFGDHRLPDCLLRYVRPLGWHDAFARLVAQCIKDGLETEG